MRESEELFLMERGVEVKKLKRRVVGEKDFNTGVV